MVGFSRAMNDDGVATLRFNFPYMDAARAVAGPRNRSR